MSTALTVRSYHQGDAEALGQVMFDAIRTGASTRYGAAACEAWCPRPPTGEDWAAKLAAQDCVVAERARGVLGFMSLTEDGLLDLAFVLPEVMGTGVADALYAVLQGRALATRKRILRTQASLMARGFFLRHGWREVGHELVERSGPEGTVPLQRFAMDKDLRSAAKLAA